MILVISVIPVTVAAMRCSEAAYSTEQWRGGLNNGEGGGGGGLSTCNSRQMCEFV